MATVRKNGEKGFRNLRCNDGGPVVGKLFDWWGQKSVLGIDRGAGAGTGEWGVGG